MGKNYKSKYLDCNICVVRDLQICEGFYDIGGKNLTKILSELVGFDETDSRRKTTIFFQYLRLENVCGRCSMIKLFFEGNEILFEPFD